MMGKEMGMVMGTSLRTAPRTMSFPTKTTASFTSAVNLASSRIAARRPTRSLSSVARRPFALASPPRAWQGKRRISLALGLTLVK